MAKPKLEIGDIIEVTLKVTVTDVSDAHGLCYQVELPHEDYYPIARTFWLDDKEINEE